MFNHQKSDLYHTFRLKFILRKYITLVFIITKLVFTDQCEIPN